MFHILPLIILSAGLETPADLYEEALQVYECNFEEAADSNFDGWPDGWTRRRGRGYPLYLKVEIGAAEAAQGNCLRMDLDGGAALVNSPAIDISPLFSYLLKARIKTEGLKHDVAYCEVVLYDDDRKVLEKHTSQRYREDTDWTEVLIGPITPAHTEARFATIALHLSPTKAADLRGAAMFDEIWLGRLPRMSIDTGSEHNVFTNQQEVKVDCHVSGFTERDLLLRFELQDVDGKIISTTEKPIRQDKQSSTSVALSQQRSDQQRGYSGSASWSPVIEENGFYRIRVSMPGLSGDQVVSLAVVEPQTITKTGEFGWGLPQGDHPISLKALPGLLRHVGIHWAKFPVWYDDENAGRADQLAWLAERLSSSQIRMVGMLDQPPASVREMFGEKGRLPVASVFVEPEVWHPAVDPVMTRLSLKVRWWQLGSDFDTSFVNFPQLEKKISQIRQDLNRFGQEINMGIAWRSIDETPSAKAPPWAFLSYVAEPPLTANELRAYLARERDNPARRWVVLNPLSEREYDLKTRSKDLVLRMLAAKMENVDGIFIPDPFDPERGLMNAQGKPNELLLVWRTTAQMISGAQHLGSITLPRRSKNHFFVRGDKAVMVVWNDKPTTETIYLGENVEQIDLWGRELPVSQDKDGSFVRQTISVGPLPTFVMGVSPHVARWRRSFEFETQRLASVFGREQTVIYRFRNTFDQGVGGTVLLETPIVKESKSAETKFKLATDEEQRLSFRVVLGVDVNSGPQPVRADFTITADRSYRFSVYRTIEVGLGDVEVNLSSRLDEDGNLIVEQVLINKTDQFVSFNSLLIAPDRKRQRRAVRNLGRGRTENSFVFPNGQELIGSKLWLRAEEIGGARVLNHHIIAHR